MAKSKRKARKGAGELGEEELEKVSGGVFPAALGSGGVSPGFPDVCKMPGPPAPFVPVPYPNTADATGGATKTATRKKPG